MIYRKDISDKVLYWLKKGDSIPKVAMKGRSMKETFNLQCKMVIEEIQKAGYDVCTTNLKKGVDQILIKVILYDGYAEIELTTKTYAIVHTTWFGIKRKKIITLDKDGNVRKLKKIPNKLKLVIEGEDFDVIKIKTFSFYV